MARWPCRSPRRAAGVLDPRRSPKPVPAAKDYVDTLAELYAGAQARYAADPAGLKAACPARDRARPMTTARNQHRQGRGPAAREGVVLAMRVCPGAGIMVQGHKPSC